MSLRKIFQFSHVGTVPFLIRGSEVPSGTFRNHRGETKSRLGSNGSVSPVRQGQGVSRLSPRLSLSRPAFGFLAPVTFQDEGRDGSPRSRWGLKSPYTRFLSGKPNSTKLCSRIVTYTS